MQHLNLSIRFLAFSLTVILSVFCGCTSFMRHGTWSQPSLVETDSRILNQRTKVRSGSLELTRAELVYAMASEVSQRDDARCVDHYFEAAQFSWQEIKSRLHEKCVHDTTNELNHLYRQIGLGVPIVAVQSRTTSDDFQRKQSMFSATLMLGC